jgi:hypothetical protein
MYLLTTCPDCIYSDGTASPWGYGGTYPAGMRITVCYACGTRESHSALRHRVDFRTLRWPVCGCVDCRKERNRQLDESCECESHMVCDSCRDYDRDHPDMCECDSCNCHCSSRMVCSSCLDHGNDHPDYCECDLCHYADDADDADDSTYGSGDPKDLPSFSGKYRRSLFGSLQESLHPSPPVSPVKQLTFIF